MIDTRKHDPAGCGCDPCKPQAHPEAAPDLCNCLEDGLRASLQRWKESCDCCFGEAYPGGIEEAIVLARPS